MRQYQTGLSLTLHARRFCALNLNVQKPLMNKSGLTLVFMSMKHSLNIRASTPHWQMITAKYRQIRYQVAWILVSLPGACIYAWITKRSFCGTWISFSFRRFSVKRLCWLFNLVKIDCRTRLFLKLLCIINPRKNTKTSQSQIICTWNRLVLFTKRFFSALTGATWERSKRMVGYKLQGLFGWFSWINNF